MIILAASAHSHALAARIADHLDAPFHKAQTKKFSNGELQVLLDEGYSGKSVVVVQSIVDSANDYIIELLLIASSLKKANARDVTAIVPYLPYSRQDKIDESCQSKAIELFWQLMEVAGIDRVITVDLHSQISFRNSSIKLTNINHLTVFKHVLTGYKDYTVVAPDKGALDRATEVASYLGVPFMKLGKKRMPNGDCQILSWSSEISYNKYLIIDDIIDSGATISATIQFLKKRHAYSIDAFITHSLSTKTAVSKIMDYGLDRLYISNSISKGVDNSDARVKLIEIDHVIAKHLQCLN